MTYIGAEENASSVVAFQPTVLKGLGYTASEAQIHSIPIYAVAFVASLSCAWLAERLRQRYLFTLFGCIIAIVGLSIELAQPKAAGTRYAGMFFLTAGAYIIMPITVVWLAINVGQGYKRTVAFGMVIAVGNCGAFISSNVFITAETPKYHTGFSVGMGMLLLSVVASSLMYLGLWLEKRKLEGKALNNGQGQDGGALSNETPEEFRYHF